MDDITDQTVSPEDFGGAFDNWLSGATLSRKSIDIYGQPGLFAEFERLERELKVAEKAQAARRAKDKAAAGGDDEASLEDEHVETPEDLAVEALEKKLADLYEKWMGSKSTWTVRALPKSVWRKLGEEHPERPAPELAKDADETAKRAHRAAVLEWEKAADARNYAILGQAVVEISLASGQVRTAVEDPETKLIEEPLVTPEQLVRLRTQLGEWQLIELISASKLAATKEPVIPAPFLRSSSRTAET